MPSTSRYPSTPTSNRTQPHTPSLTRIPPNACTLTPPPELLAYYTLRRDGTILQKPYDDWGPESKGRELFLIEIETRVVAKEWRDKFRDVNWNSSTNSDEVIDEPLSPKGGPKVRAEDVEVWKGEGDYVIEKGGGWMRGRGELKEGLVEGLEAIDLEGVGGENASWGRVEGESRPNGTNTDGVRKKAGWESEWDGW